MEAMLEALMIMLIIPMKIGTNIYRKKYEIPFMLQNMQLQQNQHYEEKVKWHAAEVQQHTNFQNSQNEQFRKIMKD